MTATQEPLHPAYDAIAHIECVIEAVKLAQRELEGEVSEDTFRAFEQAAAVALRDLSERTKILDAEIDAHDATI